MYNTNIGCMTNPLKPKPNVGGYYNYITRLTCIALPPIHLKQFYLIPAFQYLIKIIKYSCGFDEIEAISKSENKFSKIRNGHCFSFMTIHFIELMTLKTAKQVTKKKPIKLQ